MAFQPLKIFVVENHEDTLTYISLYLEGSGHVINSARDMKSALEMLSESPADILICDIGLPDGDGWQLMRHLGTMDRPVPFAIAMTGFCTATDREKSLEAGFRHHLVKPFLPEELDVLMQEAMLHAALPPVESENKKTRIMVSFPDTA